MCWKIVMLFVQMLPDFKHRVVEIFLRKNSKRNKISLDNLEQNFIRQLAAVLEILEVK